MTASVLSASFLPQPAADDRARRGRARFAVALLLVPLIGVTFLAKPAIPPLGAQAIGITIPLIYLAVLMAALGGVLRIDAGRAIMFLLTIGWLGLSTVLQAEEISLTSLTLLVALHLPYIFELAETPAAAGKSEFGVQAFLVVATVLAWLGLAQFAVQWVAGPKLAFPIETFVPARFLVQYFNAQGVLSYGSDIFRSTGVFMLEPSYLSQLLAVAIVAELCTSMRLTRVALFALGMLVTYSGTGIMILALCVPLLLARKRRWDLLLAGVLCVAALFALREYFYLDQFLSRAGEFSSPQSSGFARFVGGFYLFDQFLWDHPLRALFGYGAGTFKIFMERSAYPVVEMPLFKMVMEFGIVGALVYFTFICYCFFTCSVSRMIAVAVLLTALLNGLYVPFSQGLALTLLIWPSVRTGRAA